MYSKDSKNAPSNGNAKNRTHLDVYENDSKKSTALQRKQTLQVIEVPILVSKPEERLEGEQVIKRRRTKKRRHRKTPR